jgi:TAT (twin-arginine translocation) pathway signal sequence
MTPSLNRRDFLQATVATTALAWIPTEGKPLTMAQY